jgi:predicted 3-demethylubiquinone-9 3-methyltransferase (glyoxalase superfamily)
MKKITPFLWFEKDMDAVVNYYASIFPDVKISNPGQPRRYTVGKCTDE